MPALTPAGLSRSTTDRLLDGGTGPEPLEHLLAAAAAPPQADEVSGEQAARQAFVAAAGFQPLLAVAPNRPRRRTRALSWIVAAKAIAAVALTAGAGGVAVAATSSSFPAGPPEVSNRLEAGPNLSIARPTVVVDRARGTTPQPDTEPAPESSPGSPDSARRDSTESGETASRTAPDARSDQPGKPEIDAAPNASTPAARPKVSPGNPQHVTGPANGNKKPIVETPPGQQQGQKNNGHGTAGAEKDNPGNSDHVDDPRSDTAKQRQQQKAGPE
jgi:hypothetical protein